MTVPQIVIVYRGLGDAPIEEPILAQVCTACGYIELYAPQPINRRETVTRSEELAQPEMAVESPIPTT